MLGVRRVNTQRNAVTKGFTSKLRERVRVAAPTLPRRGWVDAAALSGDWVARAHCVEEWPGADSDEDS